MPTQAGPGYDPREDPFDVRPDRRKRRPSGGGGGGYSAPEPQNTYQQFVSQTQRNVAQIYKATGGTLPPSVAMALSGLKERERDLIRAARMAARHVDIAPQVIWGKGVSVKDLYEPGTTKQMKLSTFRRITDNAEPLLLAGMLPSLAGKTDKGGGQTRRSDPGTSYKRLSQMVRVIGRALPDHDLKMQQGLGAAMQLAESNIDPKRLEQNLRIVGNWGRAAGRNVPWNQALAIAQAGVRENKVFAGIRDVQDYLAPEVAVEAERAAAIRGGTREQVSQVLEGASGEQVSQLSRQGLVDVASASDLQLQRFDGDAEEFLARGEELSEEIVEQRDSFKNSALNKYLLTPAMKGLSLLDRPFQVTAMAGKELLEFGAFGDVGKNYSRVMEKENPLAPYAVQTEIEQFTEDAAAAWQGKTRLSDTLVRDWGYPRWQAEATEFLVGWYVDPVIIAGKAGRVAGLRNLHPGLKKAGDTVFGALPPGTETPFGLTGIGDAGLARYAGKVDRFIGREGDSFVKAVLADSDDELVKWSRRFKAPVTGQSAFDLTYLNYIRAEALKRGVNADEIKDALRVHFLGAPRPNSLGDTTFRARMKLSEDIRREAAEAGLDQNRIDDAAERLYAAQLAGSDEPIAQLPHRLELPTRNLPVPGMGFQKWAGNTFVGSKLGQTGFGRNLTKLPNVNPGDLNVHQDPDRWFRLSGRRAGLPEERVIHYENEAARAWTLQAPEQRLKELKSAFETEVLYHHADAVRMPHEVADQVFKDLTAGVFDGTPTREFGVTNVLDESGEVPVVTQLKKAAGEPRPMGSSQLINELPAVDPVRIRNAVYEYAGTIRRARAEFLNVLKSTDPIAYDKAAKVSMRTWMDIGNKLGGVALSAFKLTAVARPAYIFRVVLGDELLRSVATIDSVFENASAYSIGARALQRAPTATLVDKLRNPIDTTLGATVGKWLDNSTVGGRKVADIDIVRPGALPDQPAFNTYSDYADLIADTQQGARRKEQALKATGDFIEKRPGDDGYLQSWAWVLNNHVKNSPGLSEAARAIGAGEVNSVDAAKAWMRKWVRTPEGKREMVRIGRRGWEYEDWADEAAEQVWGYTLGQPKLAKAAHHGEVDDAILTKIPASVDGGGGLTLQTRPTIFGPKLAALSKGKESWLHRGVNRWYGLMVRNPENTLNRQHYGKLWMQRAKETYIAALRDAGVKIDDEVLQKIDDASLRFAVAHNKRIMFDFTENTRIGELLSFGVPFMQPFLENFAVWGHILTRRNPALIGYVNRLSRAAQDAGFIKKDENGEYTIPETWWMATVPLLWMIGGRESAGKFSLSTQLTSLNMFASSTFKVGGLPVPAPSLSPFAGWPLQQYFKDRNVYPGLEHYLFQFGAGAETPGEAALDAFVPRWARLAAASQFPALFAEDKYNSLTTDFLRMQQYLGQEPDLERAQTQARQTLAYMGLTAAIFPGSPRIKFPHTEVENEYHAKVDELGDYDAARDWFLERYPEYWAITIPKTAAEKIYNWVDSEGEKKLRVGEVQYDAPEGIRPEASQFADAIVSQPGFKEFANDPHTGLWAMALVLQVGNPKAHEFDPGVWAKQVTDGSTRYRTGQEVFEDIEDRDFFEDYRRIDASYDDEFKKLERQGYDSNDEIWINLSSEKGQELERLGQEYPGSADRYLVDRQDGDGKEFAFSTQERGPQGIHPLILESIGRVLNSEAAKDLPAIQGLDAYWDFRNEIKDKMARKGFTGLERIGAERIKKEYAQGVKRILEDHPAFEVFYNTWFDQDLQYGVKTKGRVILDKWETENPEKYDRYVDFTSALDNYTTRASEARANGLKVDESQVYFERTRYINDIMRTNPEFLRTRRLEMTHGERAQVVNPVFTRPPEFYSRDDWDVVGVKIGARASKWLEEYQARSLAIQQWNERRDGRGSSGPLHEDLNRWLNTKLGKDKGFDEAIKAMGTFGYGAIAKGYTKQKGKAGRNWKALIDFANTIREAAEAAKIHGDDSRVEFDEEKRAWWNDRRDDTARYIKVLQEDSSVFKKQWEQMASDYGDNFVYWLIPEVHFKLGQVDAY